MVQCIMYLRLAVVQMAYGCLSSSKSRFGGIMTWDKIKSHKPSFPLRLCWSAAECDPVIPTGGAGSGNLTRGEVLCSVAWFQVALRHAQDISKLILKCSECLVILDGDTKFSERAAKDWSSFHVNLSDNHTKPLKSWKVCYCEDKLTLGLDRTCMCVWVVGTATHATAGDTARVENRHLFSFWPFWGYGRGL